jgi:hypothetical protein
LTFLQEAQFEPSQPKYFCRHLATSLYLTPTKSTLVFGRKHISGSVGTYGIQMNGGEWRLGTGESYLSICGHDLKVCAVSEPDNTTEFCFVEPSGEKE